MSLGSTLFLTLTLAAFLFFGSVLFTVFLWSNVPAKPVGPNAKSPLPMLTAVVVGLGLLAGVVAGAVVFSAEQPAPTFQAVAAG
jgi:hypothetical protein